MIRCYPHLTSIERGLRLDPVAPDEIAKFFIIDRRLGVDAGQSFERAWQLERTAKQQRESKEK
jgi:hypothetical protein